MPFSGCGECAQRLARHRLLGIVTKNRLGPPTQLLRRVEGGEQPGCSLGAEKCLGGDFLAVLVDPLL
jgi:hypothetical protein